MKKAAVAAAVAVFALGSLSGAAFAGDHGSNPSQKSDSAQTTPSSDQQAGQKPDNTTDHNTSCTTGGGQGNSATCHSDGSSKADASKRYGNGQTAAQIANGKGAPSGTAVTGPGNSQPHKICGRDVHAYKGGDCSKQHEQPKQPPAQNGNAHGKVYICHATGSATNPYVLIHVSVNALPAHTGHQDGRDIVLGDNAGPCPAAGHVQGTTTTMTTTTTVTPTTTAAPVTTTIATTTTTSASTTTTTTAAAVAPASNTTPPASTSGVKGASHTSAAPASAAKPSGGVLGAAKTLGRTATSGTLPFTGLRLWIVELIALGLIGAGVATRLVARRQDS